MDKNTHAHGGSARSHEHKDRTIVLTDGRKLGFAEYGAPGGMPVLFCHGAPGSRYIHADMAGIAAQHNVRLIAVERPGFGLSDVKPGRTLLDWADDAAAVMDKLGIDKFSLIGFSMGSIYAFACAYKFPQRIRRIALSSALKPLDTPEAAKDMPPAVSGLYALARTNPIELRNILATIASTPATLLATMAASGSEWDKKVLEARQAEFEIEFSQALRTGVDGIAADIILNSQSWGFPIDAIKTETHLWCGTEDCNTPPTMTAYFSDFLPNSQTFMLQGAGHYALYPHWEEILKRLVSH